MTRAALKPRTEADLEADRAAIERADRLDTQRSIQERRALATGQDIEPEQRTRTKYKPHQRRQKLDGLDSLKAKLTPAQTNAGRRFEAYWRAAHRSDVQSCLKVMEAKHHSLSYTPTEALAYARKKLSEADEAISYHKGMWQALSAVCGEGKRLDEVTPVRRDQDRMSTRLDCALTVLAKLWGV